MDDNRKKRLKSAHVIFKAIFVGDISTINHLLKSNQNIIFERSKELWTPLHVAVINCNEMCVNHLLSNGADPVAKDVEGKCSLHWAAHRNVPFSIFKMLTSECSECLDVVDNFGRTPLHYVCMRRATCEKDLDKETDKYELIRKLRFLLPRTGSIDLQDYEGNTPLLLLTANIHNAIFAEEIDRNFLPEDLDTFKSKSLCGFILEMFMHTNANFQARNTYGMTPLHFACQTKCVEMVRLLLSNNTDTVPPVDESGNSPITMSFVRSQMQCLSLHYDVKQSPWFPFADQKVRFEDTLRPVIKRWKSVNIQQMGSGFTALHYAIMDTYCSFNVVKGLVEYGSADVNIKDHLGKTPLHYGLRPILIVPSPLAKTLFENWRNKITYLIQKGADVNAQDLGGYSPLHDACLAGDFEFLSMLLSNNADATQRNKCGATPLHLLKPGVVQSHPILHDPKTVSLTVALLLEKGSDLNCRDMYGSTALHYAIYNDAKEVVLKLVESGANKNIKDVNGEDSIQYCQRLGRTDIMTILTGEDKIAGSENDMKDDCFMTPIEISKASDWLTSYSAQQHLPDSKIRELLLESETSRLSNSPSENIVLKQLLNLMQGVLVEVERIDPRFKSTLELAGSSREGTKVKAPDEFDLLCFLDKFHSLCEIEEADNNFVYCRIKSENCYEYDNLCDSNNLLSAHKLTTLFYFCLRKALSNPTVWQFAEGFTMESTADDLKSEEDISGIQCLHFRYCDAIYKNLAISCDIVPVIRMKNWWPSFARHTGALVSSEVKTNGCMVIVKPQTEFTVSGERVRLLTKFGTSVYLSECSVLLSVPKFVRQAYKLAKILLKEKNLFPPLTEDMEPEGKGKF